MRSSLAQDATFNTASFAVRVVGSLITVAWVARSLGPEGQGRFGFALWVAAALAQIALWGLGSSMVRFVARAVGAGQPEDARHVIDQAGRWLVPTVGGKSLIQL